MTPEQLSFLEYEFTTSSLLAALATRRKTHPTYAANATDQHRETVKLWLRSYLVQLGKRYQRRSLSEEEHLQEIRILAAEASRIHARALHEGRFRFGVAQKLVNLYLKYLWSVGIVSTVHHCPLDRIINDEANLGYQWNASDSEVEYVQAIFKLRAHVGGELLQKWEICAFQLARSAPFKNHTQSD